MERRKEEGRERREIDEKQTGEQKGNKEGEMY